jgi:heme exporter protein CcmD
MSHIPYIIAAYTVGSIVLAWCALAPLARKKSALRNIRRLIQIEERSNDPDA